MLKGKFHLQGAGTRCLYFSKSLYSRTGSGARRQSPAPGTEDLAELQFPLSHTCAATRANTVCSQLSSCRHGVKIRVTQAKSKFSFQCIRITVYYSWKRFCSSSFPGLLQTMFQPQYPFFKENLMAMGLVGGREYIICQPDKSNGAPGWLCHECHMQET